MKSCKNCRTKTWDNQLLPFPSLPFIHFPLPPFPSLCFTSFPFTSLRLPSLRFIHFPSLPYPFLHFTSLHLPSFTSLHFLSLHFPSLYFINDFIYYVSFRKHLVIKKHSEKCENDAPLLMNALGNPPQGCLTYRTPTSCFLWPLLDRYQRHQHTTQHSWLVCSLEYDYVV